MDPKQREAALKNQENLKTLQREFPEYERMQKTVERSTLGKDREGNLSLGESHQTSLEDRAKEIAADKIAEKALELLADGLKEGAGHFVAPALDLAHVAGDIRQDKLLNLANNSPEARLWREQKTVGLVADKLAPGLVRDKPLGTFKTVEGERARLIEGYWATKAALETQQKNMAADSRVSKSAQSQTTISKW